MVKEVLSRNTNCHNKIAFNPAHLILCSNTDINQQQVKQVLKIRIIDVDFKIFLSLYIPVATVFGFFFL